MSQFCQKRLKFLATSALLTLSMGAVTATAAINKPGLKAPLTPNKTHIVTLQDFNKDMSSPVLDWQNPIYSVKFDVPDTDWTSAAKFILSIDPVGRVAADAPIYVQLNSDTPVKLQTRGAGFDARVELDPAKIRTRHNVLRVYYAAPASANCLLPEHGAWVINLEASKLSLRRNAKNRNLNIRDVELILKNPVTAPKSVNLVAKGSGATTLQSLIVQGVGLRMDAPPQFNAGKGQSDFEIIAGRRDMILPYVKSETVFNTRGPRLILDEGRPTRLILTGDTEAEVLNLAREFGNYTLPNTRRTMTSTGEILMQSPLTTAHKIVSRNIKLSELGDTAFDSSWNPKDRILTFDVEDPHASQGEILLRLANPKTVTGSGGTLTLSLNDYNLGQTKLDRTRKSVAFKIPAGVLKGQNNQLRMNADINAELNASCDAQTYADNGIYLGQGSRLSLYQDSETPINDLSRFAATGAPFSDERGRDTLIVLPENNRDYQLALGLLAKLAKNIGESWKNATYIRGVETIDILSANKNVLFITPSSELPQALKSEAPKSFLSAMRGQSFKGENLLQADIDRYASLDAYNVYKSVARKTASQNSISKGGVAAIYRSPFDSDKLVGVITNVPGHSFETALTSLKQPDHWNALEGSVARWSENSVLMAELSEDIVGFERSKRPTSAVKISGWELPRIPLPNYESVQFKLSDINWPNFSNLDVPQLDTNKLKFWSHEESYSQKPASDNFLDTALKISETSEVTKDRQVVSVAQLNLRGLSSLNTQNSADSIFNFLKPMEYLTKLRWSKLDVDLPTIQMPNLNLSQSITTLQRDLQPLRQNWKAKLRGLSTPGESVAKWGLNKMSAAALLLILVFSLVVVFLGFASPQNRSGAYR